MAGRREEVQRGLPGVLAEEGELPSETVLSGELLSERRRESLSRLREALGDRPDGYDAAEWRVVVGLLAPSGVGLAGVRSRDDRARLARDCFPGLSAPAALRAFLEVSRRPHVAQVVNDFRALEGLDVLEQRGMVREVLYQVMGLAAGVPAIVAADPSGGAKVATAVVQAAKALMDLDGLRAARPVDDGAGGDGDGRGRPALPGADPGAALAEKVARTLADLRARRAG